jgi:hypothetical protein
MVDGGNIKDLTPVPVVTAGEAWVDWARCRRPTDDESNFLGVHLNRVHGD